MKVGDCITYFRRVQGRIVAADFVVIVKLATSCAVVRYAGETQNAQFTVMTTDLKGN